MALINGLLGGAAGALGSLGAAGALGATGQDMVRSWEATPEMQRNIQKRRRRRIFFQRGI